jgi:hypothetical protein
MKVADWDKIFVRTIVPKIQRHDLQNISPVQENLTPNSFSIQTSSLYR